MLRVEGNYEVGEAPKGKQLREVVATRAKGKREEAFAETRREWLPLGRSCQLKSGRGMQPLSNRGLGPLPPVLPSGACVSHREPD